MNSPVKKLLPQDTRQAMLELVKISQSLSKLADRETQALVQNDLVTFAILQDEKELLTERYVRLSEEFRSRLEEFRDVDQGLLTQLNVLQQQLAEKSHSNNMIVTDMRRRAEQKTSETLLTAQELGQQRPVKFGPVPAQEERI